MNGSSITVNPICPHRMACGWCDLKQRDCDYISPITYPHTYEPMTVQVYAAPGGQIMPNWYINEEEAE